MSNKPPTHVRKRLFVDPKVQGTLLLRVAVYWVGCTGAIALLLLCWHTLTGPARIAYSQLDDLWFHYGPVLVASLLTLPLVLIDLLRVSNRFTGPLLRVRRSMRQLARGEHVAPITLRDGDFWHDFAEEFNALVAKVNRTPNQRRSDSTPQGSSEPESVEIGV